MNAQRLSALAFGSFACLLFGSLSPASAAPDCPGGYEAPPAPPRIPFVRPNGPIDRPGDTTGGPRGASGAPAAGPAVTPTGTAPTTPPPAGPITGAIPSFRGKTAKSVLAIDWDHFVYDPAATPISGTPAGDGGALILSRADALALIAGDDPRPLLVLRECAVCRGTEDALLRKDVDNEKTFLLSNWFHCVKLPYGVSSPTHPLHGLFGKEAPEHLFLSTVDGETHVALEQQTSRKQLWKDMTRVLASEYRKSPSGPLKQITRSLDKLDDLDQRLFDAKARLDDEIEDAGPGSNRALKLGRAVDELRAEQKGLLAEIAELRQLELKRPAAPAPEPAPEPVGPAAPDAVR